MSPSDFLKLNILPMFYRLLLEWSSPRCFMSDSLGWHKVLVEKASSFMFQYKHMIQVEQPKRLILQAST